MSVLFITHDLGVVARLCDRVTVMYGGFVMESCGVREIYKGAVHPYTKALLSAIPRLDDRGEGPLAALEGEPIDPIKLPEGCVFAPRCPYCFDECLKTRPEMTDLGSGHSAACHLTAKGGGADV